MRHHLVAIALSLLAALPAGCAASRAAGPNTPEQSAVMAPVHQFIDGFNAGDIPKALAACTDEMAILDEFPPHEWHGAGAFARWIGDFAIDAKVHGITDGHVALGTPRHVDVTVDRAYVVVPADYTFKIMGRPGEEADATLTIALQKGAAGWRITSFCWTRN